MERLKTNKIALLLFIATISVLIMNIILFKSELESVRNYVPRTGISEEAHKQWVKMISTLVPIVVIINGTLMIFQTVCGAKCSLFGRWRIATIIFGAILVIDDFWSVIHDYSDWIWYLKLAISVTYLVSAIMCKSDDVKVNNVEKSTEDDWY